MKWGLEEEGESPCLDCGVSVVGKHSSLWSSVVPWDRSNRHGEILLPAFLEACPPSSFAPVYCGYASDLWHKAPPCLISWTWCEIVFLSGRFGQGSKLGIIKGFSLLHMKKERKREILSRNILSRDFEKTNRWKNPATPIAMGRITSSGGVWNRCRSGWSLWFLLLKYSAFA